MNIDEAIKTISENIEDSRVKDFFQPHLDRHFTKSLDTWKKNNLPDLIQAAAATEKTPEQKRADELQAELDKMKAEAARKEFESQVLAYGMSKGLPETLCKGLAIENIETARGLIDQLSGQIRSLTEERNIKAASGPVPKGGQAPETFNLERISEMSADDIYKNLDNLTKGK